MFSSNVSLNTAPRNRSAALSTFLPPRTAKFGELGADLQQ
jgi:hypothetical protein